MDSPLSFERLKAAVAGEAVAVRAVTRLMPAGGPSDKVFPPTYAGAQYAYEERWIEKVIDDREVMEKVLTVLLDSVQSQANRMEQALLEAFRKGTVQFPVIEVDFSGENGLEDIGKITSLDAPHRIADAILRDSLYNGTAFRLSEPGRRFTDSSLRNATALFELCPTALIFGVWDSTGPRGGLGAKFERALVSEIIGVDPVTGRKTGGRLDPLQIRANLGKEYTIYKHQDPKQVWTLDQADSLKNDKGEPVPVGKRQTRGRPSSIVHGNVTPDYTRAQEDIRTPDGELVRQGDVLDGGVTICYALQISVLSLAALRRLAFPMNRPGSTDRDVAARTALAALALAGVVLQREHGYDLRSRCLLVPQEPLVFEVVPPDGSRSTRYTLNLTQAAQLVGEAVQKAKEQGLKWETKPILLAPASKLVRLVQRSRELEMARVEPEEAEVP